MNPLNFIKRVIFYLAVGDMELHISNLLGGLKVLESVVDLAINSFWSPFLPIILPFVNDLVSTSFTDIFDKSFRNFPFEKIIKY
jgi:hypothetical protein